MVFQSLCLQKKKNARLSCNVWLYPKRSLSAYNRQLFLFVWTSWWITRENNFYFNGIYRFLVRSMVNFKNHWVVSAWHKFMCLICANKKKQKKNRFMDGCKFYKRKLCVYFILSSSAVICRKVFIVQLNAI